MSRKVSCVFDTYFLYLLQIMNEDDKLWPVPDRIGRQVCVYRQYSVKMSSFLLFSTGAGDCDRRCSHIFHDDKDWQSLRLQELKV